MAQRLVSGWDDGQAAAEALRKYGLRADAADLGDPPVEVWPDNVLAKTIFEDMQTSWNVVAMVGVTGLRWEVLPVFLSARRVDAAAHGELLDCLKVMEDAGLQLLNDKG